MVMPLAFFRGTTDKSVVRVDEGTRHCMQKERILFEEEKIYIFIYIDFYIKKLFY